MAQTNANPSFFPPEFIKRPKSETVNEGGVARFTCEVDAKPPPMVEWTRDGVVIDSNGHYKVRLCGVFFPEMTCEI